ncbi:uncharacterized protein [Halyomorpha halys]|uniref:uncharacterized protein isoform X1 n=2 Tax=Halyomorpha halys TaxID=286706 RepID=UPI0006D50816|nr:uncharacterized protein LOC106685900 isoform X1 [Halyomorpha halys]
MVGTNEKKDLLLVMNNKSDASKWNTYAIPQFPDSASRYGVQLKRGRKPHIRRTAIDKRRRLKIHKEKTHCSCAANCNCKCVKCVCQQKVAMARNAEIIRARKQAKRKVVRPNKQSEPNNLVNQLTELVRARSARRRAQRKKYQEKQSTPSGQSNESSQARQAERKSTGSRKNEPQNNDPAPATANDRTRFSEGKPNRKRNREESPYTYRIVHDIAKPKGVRHQAKKRRLQQANVSTVSSHSGSASYAIAKIRKLRKHARDRNFKPKHPKKEHQ